MYEVEWSPSIICENHINVYHTNLNYKPKTITPLPDLDDMHLADHHIVTNLINIMGPGVTPSSLRKVTWEPRSEPLSNLTWQPSWESLNHTHTKGPMRRPRQPAPARKWNHWTATSQTHKNKEYGAKASTLMSTPSKRSAISQCSSHNH